MIRNGIKIVYIISLFKLSNLLNLSPTYLLNFENIPKVQRIKVECWSPKPYMSQKPVIIMCPKQSC